MTLSINFDGQFEDGLSVSDSLCTAASEKIGEGVSVGKAEGGDCTQASLGRIIHFRALV